MPAVPRTTTSLPPPILPGRRAELELIGRELARAQSGEGRFVALVGEPGVGKTRLLREAARQSEMLVLDLHVPPERLGPDDLLEDWLTPLLSRRVRHSDVQDLVMVAATYPRLGTLFPVAKAIPPRAVGPAPAAIARLMAHAAGHRALLLLVDDFPRMRFEARTLVVEIALALAGAPALFLATARPEGEPLRDRALSPLVERHLFRQIDVRPLDEEGVRSLIVAELDSGMISPLHSWLYAKSGGNPLFAVELLRALEGQGTLCVDEASGRWRLVGPLEKVRIPASIAHVLDSRRRGLPPELTRPLRIFALLGPDAPASLLASALGVDEEAVDHLLQRLARAGLLEHHKRYAFAHPLMAEHWQNELNEEERRRLSAGARDRILDAISRREATRPGLVHGSCASGLETGRDDELARLLLYAIAAEDFATYVLAAVELGRRSLASQRPREAASWARRGARQLTRVADVAACRWLRAQLDHLMGKALFQEGRVPAAEARLRRFARAPEASDPRLGIQVFPRLGQLLIRDYQPEKARDVLHAGLTLLTTLDGSDPSVCTTRSEILCYLARIETTRGALDAADGLIAQAVEALGELGGDAHGAEGRELIVVERAVLATRRGDYRQAISNFEELVDLSRLRPAAYSLRLQSLGIYLALAGDLRRARTVVLESLRTGKRLQDRAAEGIRWSYLGLIEAMAGNWRQVAAAQGRARELAERVGDLGTWYLAMGELARARQVLEGDEASDRTWQEARMGSAAVGAPNRPQLYHLFSARAWVLCHRHDWEGARDACAQAMAHLRRPHPLNEAEVELLACEVEVRAWLADRQTTGAGLSADAGSIPSAIKEAAQRCAMLEAHLRDQRLSNQLVDLARVRLHMVAAGWQGMAPEALLAELEGQLLKMDAPARIAEIAREFAGTPIASQQRFRSFFLPALAGGHPGQPAPIPGDSPATEEALRVELAERDAPGHCLRIQALGRLQVTRAGQEEPMTRAHWGSRKARLLLAYFLAQDGEGRGVSREALCEAVWPESESFSLDHTFRVTMNLLRKALRPSGPPAARDAEGEDAPYLVFKEGLYRFDFGSASCDTREFEEALRDAAAHEREGQHDAALKSRRRAFDLYQGEFLADFDEIWIEPSRERYRRRFIAAGRSLFEAALTGQRIPEAQEIAERLVCGDPLSEEGHRLLIRAYLAAEQSDAAIRQLERCRTIMAHELGLAVSAETEALLKPSLRPTARPST